MSGERAEPQIYVASLSDYNAGRLHGRWIDAAQDPEKIHAEITDLLEASPQRGAEEWATHDYQGFGPVAIDEYESVARIARLACGIVEHGMAFAHWAAVLESDQWDRLDDFSDHFRGCWPTMEAYASELLQDMGAYDALEQLSSWLQSYVSIDEAAFARDLAMDLWSSEDEDGVYIFDPL
jgi:antirestriction protein